MFIAAIDVAKFHHCVSIINDKTGVVVVEPFYFDNNADGFKSLHKALKPYLKKKILVGMEATGHYGDNLIRYLLDLNEKKLTVGLINPIATGNEAKKKTRRTKTDKIDTTLIYKVLSDEQYTKITKKKLAMREAKQLCRAISSLNEDICRYKAKLQKCIDIVFPEINDYFSTKYSRSYMIILKEFGSAYNLAHTRIDHISNVLTYKGRGKRAKCDPESLKLCAKNSIGENNEAIVFEIKSLISLIELLEEQILEYTKKIGDIASQLNSPIFTIPGIGTLTGMTILSEINDISQFPDVKKLIAFAGVDPAVHESGQYKSNRMSISKRGSAYLRKALYQDALTVCKYNSTFSDYYTAKRAEGKSHRCAQGHVVRKLLRVIYKLLSESASGNAVSFDPTKLK